MEKENTYFGVKEIARRANVSIATVDRVLHNRTGVSEKTKKKINAIIKELNYQPNILASRLASKKKITIAILLPKVSDETGFWKAPLRGIQRAESEIKKYGVHLIPYLFDLNNKDSFQEQANRILKSDKINGVLLAPSFIEESTHFVEECHKSRIPVVFIDSNLPDLDNFSYIGPHLFQSGYVAGKLLTYRLKQDRKVLVINISAETENYNYVQIEEGFRTYFKDHNQTNEIIRLDIHDTDVLSVARHLTQTLYTHPDIAAIFVTNSRVFSIARYLFENNRLDIALVGYDFIEENVEFLEKGVIDFLICHKPEEQGYRGVMALYQNLVMNTTIEKVHFMPIDIITKENQTFYLN